VSSCFEFCEMPRIGESDGRTGAAKLVAMVKTLQTCQELAPKDAAEDFYR
jgi:hypothetical protein